MGGTEGSGNTRALALIAVAIVAFEGLIVLLVLGQGHQALIGGDSSFYELMANNLIRGHGLSTSTAAPYQPAVWRSPGYPGFLATLKIIGLGSPLAVRIVQFALLAITAVVVGKTTERLFDFVTARAATMLVTTTLPLIWAATWHMSETLAALGLSIAIYLLVRARDDEWRTMTLAAAGIALAATIYVRPTLLVLLPVIALGIALDSGFGATDLRRLIPAGAFTLACVLTIVPWSVRNYVHTGDVIPVETGRGTTLIVSAHEYAGDMGIRATPEDLAVLVGVSRDASRSYRRAGFSARQQVQADNAAARAAPWDRVSATDVAKQIPDRLSVMLGPISEHPPGVPAESLLERTALVQGALIFVLAIVALAASPGSVRRLWPVWAAPLAMALTHLVLHVEPRYSIPQRPEIAILAAAGLVFAYGYVRRRAWAPAPSV